MPEPTHRLRIRRVDRVGFVDKGDDPKAEIVFWKRLHDDELGKTIVERGGKFLVMDAAGTRILGTHSTRAEAMAQLRAVEAKKRDERLDDDVHIKESGRMKNFMKAVARKLKMSDDEVEKLLADDDFDVSKLSEDAQAQFQKLNERIEELEKATGDDDGDGDDDPDDGIPEAIAKRLEAAEELVQKAQAETQKLRDEKERERFIKIAADLDLPPDDFADPLRKMSDALEPEDFKKVEERFKALNKQVAEGKLYTEIGKGGWGVSEPAETRIQTIAEEIRKEHPDWTLDRARGEAWRLNPELRNTYEKARRRAVKEQE